ncbi:MAG: L,D-transpeptidase family protein [Pseudomonadota bacterium]|nr:L,D-transpeptidase family protein [Pseudomonadota bacterium]
MAAKRFGKAMCLALFSVSLATCGDGSGGDSAMQAGAQVLKSDVEGAQSRAFYEARGWVAAWDDDAAEKLQAAIGNAPAHGLRAAMFLRSPLPDDPARRELALTRAALLYASALSSGFVDPKSLGNIYTIPRPKPNLAAGLNQALQSGDIGAWLESLAPQTDEYRAMSKAFLQYRQLAAQKKASTIPDGGLIRPGRRDPRIPALAEALQANGYLDAPPGEPQNPPRYLPALVEAVKRLQADYGMKPDGVIGPDTLDALNRGPADRARRLAVGMERLRWTERNPPPTRIDVNTAATFLDYWRGGQHVERRRVVTGEPEWETPQLQSPMVSLVANPIWRVPDSIWEDELASKGSAYFAANNMTFRDGKLVQLPGPKNSLGQVKFDMENNQSIYLHDTPAKTLFAEVERHRSHGCVRVEGAVDFAMQLASENGVLPDLQEGLASGDETFVKLKRAIPVRLLYRTAYYDGGIVRLVPDIYGWDNPIAAKLGLGSIPPRRRPGHRRGVDVGP